MVRGFTQWFVGFRKGLWVYVMVHGFAYGSGFRNDSGFTQWYVGLRIVCGFLHWSVFAKVHGFTQRFICFRNCLWVCVMARGFRQWTIYGQSYSSPHSQSTSSPHS